MFGPLRAFAVQAGQGQVGELGLTPVLPGDDVVDLKGRGIEADRELAIVAAVSGALPDLLD